MPLKIGLFKIYVIFENNISTHEFLYKYVQGFHIQTKEAFRAFLILLNNLLTSIDLDVASSYWKQQVRRLPGK